MVYNNTNGHIGHTRPLQGLPLGDFILNHASHPATIEFNNICMSVKGREQPILKKVSGKAKPGQLVAIMGPSGSGKTTLLNALSGRSKIDEGTITLNGVKLKKEHKRQMAYILQRDLFLPNLTLFDTLKFHAEMGLPSSLSFEEKMDCMKKVAALFNLDDPNLLQTKMGDVTKRGLSGGEIKRANIACELLSNPTILFVDEPTTGLDSHNACKVVENLLTIARNNRTVVMTIHQPSYKMFQMFDTVLLLSDGEVTFYGKQEEVLPTLETLNIPIAPYSNLADILVDQCYIEGNRTALIEYVKNRPTEDSVVIDIEVDDTADNGTFQEVPMENMLTSVVVNGNSQQGNQLKVNLIVENGTTQHTISKRLGTKKSFGDSGRSSLFSDSCSNSLEDNGNDEKWPITFLNQTWTLTKRNFKDSLSKFVGPLYWIHAIGMCFALGATFYRVERKEENIYTITGQMFFPTTLYILQPSFESLSTFSSERSVINKERAAGRYRLSSYYWSKMISELPLLWILPLITFFIIKTAFGDQTATATFLQMVAVMANVLMAQSLGFFISTTIYDPLDLKKGIVACSLVVIPCILLTGFYVGMNYVFPGDFFRLVQFCNPVYNAYRAMIIIEIHFGPPIRCAENSIYEVCRSGNATFVSPGDITDLTGDPWLALLIHISVLFFYIIVFRVLGYLVLRFYNSPTKTI